MISLTAMLQDAYLEYIKENETMGLYRWLRSKYQQFKDWRRFKRRMAELRKKDPFIYR